MHVNNIKFRLYLAFLVSLCDTKIYVLLSTVKSSFFFLHIIRHIVVFCKIKSPSHTFLQFFKTVLHYK